MIVFLIVIMNLEQRIDSLHSELKIHPSITLIDTLNRCYIRQGEFQEAIRQLKEYENVLPWNEQASLLLLIGDDYLFAGALLAARQTYLTLVQRYTGSETANDALERLYMLETAREDTTMLKRLTFALGLSYAGQYHSALDSLRLLSNTSLGMHALYYMVLVYNQMSDIPLALSTLDALDKTYPDHSLLSIPVLRAELYIRIDDTNTAQDILEEFIITYPNSIYAVRARKLLETIP